MSPLVVLVDLLVVVKYDPVYVTGTFQSVRDVAVLRGHSCQLLDPLVALATADPRFVSNISEPYRFLRRDFALDLDIQRVELQVLYRTMLDIVDHLAESQTGHE